MRENKTKVIITIILLLILQLFFPIFVYGTSNITTTKYRVIDKYITNIAAGETVGMLLENVSSNTDDTIEVSGEEMDTVIHTGMKLKTGEEEYILVVLGDINKDGKNTATDLSMLKKAVVNLIELNDEYFRAGDMNNDGELTVLDVSLLKMRIVGLEFLDELDVNLDEEIRIVPSTTKPTNKLDITFKWPSDIEGLKRQVSFDGGKTFYDEVDAAVISRNVYVVARLVDSTSKVVKIATLEITNVDKEKPVVTSLEPIEVTTYSIKVEIDAKDISTEGANEDIIGIRGYKYRINGGEWSDETTDTIYEFTDLVQDATYIIDVMATDIVGNESAIRTISVQTPKVVDSSEKILFDYNPKVPTTEDVKIIFIDKSEDASLKLRYQIDSTSGTWLDYPEDGIVMTTNGTVYAKLFDSKEQSVGVTTVVVSNIDREKPEEFSIVANPTEGNETNSAKVTTLNREEVNDIGSPGTAEYYMGIIGYQFQIKDSSGNILKIKDKDGNAVLDWSIMQKEVIYTFNNGTLENGLTHGETYTVTMKAIDLAGNEREVSTDVTLATIPDSSEEGIIGVTYIMPDLTETDVLTATQGPVHVKLTNQSGNDNLILKYQIGGTDDDKWEEYTSEIKMETNGTIYIKLYDSTGQSNGIKRVDLTEIDTLPPVTATIEASDITTTTATLTATGVDAEATETNAKSGIKKYVFYVDDVEYATVETTEETATTQLTFTADSHSCHVVVYDQVGNQLASEALTVEKHVHVDECYNWTTSSGYYRWVGADANGQKYKCSLCGAIMYHVMSEDAVGNLYHCSKRIKGSLKCGK